MRGADGDREAVDARLLDEAHGVIDVGVDDLGRTRLAVAVVRPIVPSSPSTCTPTACAASTTLRVRATFCSKGSSEASIMTEVNPAWIAVMICS